MERRQPLEALRRPHRSTPRPARRVRRALLHLGGMFVAAPGLLLALGAHPAAAASTGTCTATIAGTPAAQTSVDSPVKVRPDAKVVVSGGTPSGPVSYTVRLGVFGGVDWQVASGTSTTSTWTSTVDVAKYATHGVGLYRVAVTATYGSGTACAGTAYVDVDGGALSSTAGKVGAAVAAIGAVSVLAATGLALRKGTP